MESKDKLNISPLFLVKVLMVAILLFSTKSYAEDFASQFWKLDKEASKHPMPKELRKVFNTAILVNIKQQQNLKNCEARLPKGQKKRCKPIGEQKYSLEYVEDGPVKVIPKKQKDEKGTK